MITRLLPPTGGFILLCSLFTFIMSFTFDSLYQEFTTNPEVVSTWGSTLTTQDFVDYIYDVIENHLEMGTTPTPQESYLWDYIQSHKSEFTS